MVLSSAALYPVPTQQGVQSRVTDPQRGFYIQSVAIHSPPG